jgi:formylglycine-generating enzyme required for sulfatase activity
MLKNRAVRIALLTVAPLAFLSCMLLGDTDPLTGIGKRETVSVPGGTYAQSDGAESFSHTISSFSIAKYEVTYELWYAVHEWATANGYAFESPGRGSGSLGAPPTPGSFEPVTDVSWRDVIVWCNAYSQLAGVTPVYYTDSMHTTLIASSEDANGVECDAAVPDWSANGYRLPTEGEWQYTASYIDGVSWLPNNHASGDTSSYCYPSDGGTSTVLGDYAWYNENSGMKVKDVGTRTANQLSAFDMSGNAYEWCHDWYAPYAGATTDHRGPASGSSRVVRGGSYLSSAQTLQVGRRGDSYPEAGGIILGFRVVRSD